MTKLKSTSLSFAQCYTPSNQRITNTNITEPQHKETTSVCINTHQMTQPLHFINQNRYTNTHANPSSSIISYPVQSSPSSSHTPSVCIDTQLCTRQAQSPRPNPQSNCHPFAIAEQPCEICPFHQQCCQDRPPLLWLPCQQQRDNLPRYNLAFSTLPQPPSNNAHRGSSPQLIKISHSLFTTKITPHIAILKKGPLKNSIQRYFHTERIHIILQTHTHVPNLPISYTKIQEVTLQTPTPPPRHYFMPQTPTTQPNTLDLQPKKTQPTTSNLVHATPQFYFGKITPAPKQNI